MSYNDCSFSYKARFDVLNLHHMCRGHIKKRRSDIITIQTDWVQELTCSSRRAILCLYLSAEIFACWMRTFNSCFSASKEVCSCLAFRLSDINWETPKKKNQSPLPVREMFFLTYLSEREYVFWFWGFPSRPTLSSQLSNLSQKDVLS